MKRVGKDVEQNEREPITVRCKLCGASIDLGEDSQEARDKKADPAQQIRMHLLTHLYESVTFASGAASWLIDVLAFESNDPRWDIHQSKVFEWVRSKATAQAGEAKEK